jgi:hypothetical protein
MQYPLLLAFLSKKTTNLASVSKDQKIQKLFRAAILLSIQCGIPSLVAAII